jgi:hypothetical protein
MQIHEQKQTAFLIDGYFFPRPGEELQASFERAKKELLSHLLKHIKFVEDMDYDMFCAGKEDNREVGEV